MPSDTDAREDGDAGVKREKLEGLAEEWRQIGQEMEFDGEQGKATVVWDMVDELLEVIRDE